MPPFYHQYERDGRWYRYVRHRANGKTRVVAIHVPLGTPEFTIAYEAAIDAVGARDKLRARQRASERLYDDHNAARWLEVAQLDEPPYHLPNIEFRPGWYVRRICPCHWQLLVTQAYDTEAQAERVARVMVRVSDVAERRNAAPETGVT